MMKEEKDIMDRARKRAKGKARFYTHLGIYILVNIIFLIVLLPRGRVGLLLSFGVMFAWGYVLLGEYYKVFDDKGLSVFSDSWLQKETEKEMDKMEREEDLEMPEPEKKSRSYDESDLV